MPTTLQIKDFGPLKLVNIELKKFNIIIGPQSSGKSCILKIAAFCRFVESLISSGRADRLAKNTFVESNLIVRYKLKGFAICGVSEIMYESERCKFFVSFPNGVGMLSYVSKDNNKFECEVAYIPSERDVVSVLPNIFDIKFSASNTTLEYITDWNYARKKFSKYQSLDILDLGVSYYYDTDKEQDILVIGENAEIDFTYASSGLQSVVPLCVLVDYYMGKKDKTAREYAEINSIRDLLNSDELSDQIKQQLQQEIKNKESKVLPYSIFLEEPEISIFPETQYEMVKWIVAQLSSNGMDNSIFIATHSPYVLSSFNNLIQAHNSVLTNQSKAREVMELLRTDKYVPFDEICVYEIKDGLVTNIKDYDLFLINANGIDSVSDIIQSQFSKLLDYEEN